MFEKIQAVVTITACAAIIHATFFGAGFETVDCLMVALFIRWLLK